MNTLKQNPNESGLSGLLRASRPEAALPPRFQEHVWHRIEHPELDRPAAWIETLASLLLRPRFALATVGTLMLIGVALGSLNGTTHARQHAQERYVAAVVMPMAP